MSATWSAPAELNIYAVGESGAAIVALLAELDVGDDLNIDLAELSELDAAGLQLLLATALSGRREGRRVVFAEVPELVRERFDQFGLAEYLQPREIAEEGA